MKLKPRAKRDEDIWKPLRTSLSMNTEPYLEMHTVEFDNVYTSTGEVKPPELCMATVPAHVARLCKDSSGDNVKLTKSLLNTEPVPHLTAFMFPTLYFKVTGISKSALTQLDRHGVGVVYMQGSGRTRVRAQYVYPTYHYIKDKEMVTQLLQEDEHDRKYTNERYLARREFFKQNIKGHLEDCRRMLPIDFAAESWIVCNATALRNIFIHRLDKSAEWEVRRVVWLIWDLCIQKYPQFFEDLVTFNNLGDLNG